MKASNNENWDLKNTSVTRNFANSSVQIIHFFTIQSV